jgi:hypothetical protein
MNIEARAVVSDCSIRLSRNFTLSGERSSATQVLTTLGDAAAFLQTSEGGVPWDEAFAAAREAIDRAARTKLPSDIIDATEQLERYLWTQQLLWPDSGS